MSSSLTNSFKKITTDNIFFDFDDTLIDTKAMKEAFYTELEINIPREIIEQAYQTIKDRGVEFTPTRYNKELKKISKTKKQFSNEELKHLIENSRKENIKKIIPNDTIEYLKKLSQKKIPKLNILSKGDYDFQKEKIRSLLSLLASQFPELKIEADIYIVNDVLPKNPEEKKEIFQCNNFTLNFYQTLFQNKSEALLNFQKTKSKKLTYINDKLSELEDIKKSQIQELTLIGIDRQMETEYEKRDDILFINTLFPIIKD